MLFCADLLSSLYSVACDMVLFCTDLLSSYVLSPVMWCCLVETRLAVMLSNL
uniref:Uncharacterized protein n=1 Tax=Anguilla anguilla TaxID=7936 RepID=A0A0E9TAN4_ANGAN